ncbi:MAG TPA: AraC family transcriptional regulator [Flavisolibacter sp.]|jgi:AraC-like DNA-binding protein|nr:AraC family transcriptional regulator [Flavisolibacter sp.]
MTYYQQEIERITREFYPEEAACRQVRQAKAFIDTHYADPIRLNDLAAQAHYSTYHFLRLFKFLYGTTPHQYLTRVRLKKAKDLLAEGFTTTQVCQAVGFESSSGFKALFRKDTGRTPQAYRMARAVASGRK